MYTIVVTNDDGIHAPGIHKLVQSLDGLAELFVVAPDQERSAEGHRITVREGLMIQEHDFHGMKHVKAFSVNGTPADCVKMGIHVILQRRPDLVISGINAGLNLGKDIYYSGTVSAAREAVINEIPAIAVSYDNFICPGDFGEVDKILRPIWEEIKIRDIPVDVLLNMSVPHVPANELLGVVATGLDIHHYRDRIDEKPGVRGEPEYWIERDYGKQKLTNQDYFMVENKYVTITPVHIDSTDYQFVKLMNGWKMMKSNMWRGKF